MDPNSLFPDYPLGPGDREKYVAIRETARALATVILDNTPRGAEQWEAIRKVQEAVLWSRAAVGMKGTV